MLAPCALPKVMTRRGGGELSTRRCEMGLLFADGVRATVGISLKVDSKIAHSGAFWGSNSGDKFAEAESK